MPESLRTRLFRLAINLVPAYAGSGGRVRYIASDWRELHVEVPLTLRTRNYVGTIYGGSMFGATDPFFMIMLMKNLGPAYEVWDKAASIRFRKPGLATLSACFIITEADLASIRQDLKSAPKTERTFRIALKDAEGNVHAEIERLVHIREKRS